jgi:hypothetical protein
MIIPSRTSRKSGLAIAFLLTMAASMFAADVIKVFILAGQSNMEGKVQSKLMEHQASDPKTKDLFKHWRKDDDWMARVIARALSLSLVMWLGITLMSRSCSLRRPGVGIRS